jgi:hypothetical protein
MRWSGRREKWSPTPSQRRESRTNSLVVHPFKSYFFLASNHNKSDPSIAVRKNISNCPTFSTILKSASNIAFFKVT